MASNFDDPTKWRCRFGLANIPVKYTNYTGSFEAVSGQSALTMLVPTARFPEFVNNMFPLPYTRGNLTLPRWVTLPGLPDMMATKVSFKAFNDSLPIDPYAFDPGAPEGTYGKILEVTIEYSPALPVPDPNNYLSFLEISGVDSSEYLNTTCPKGKWQEVSRNAGSPSLTIVPGPTTPPELPAVPGAKKPVKDPSVPVTILIPKTEWTVKWNQIPYDYYKSTLVKRLRKCRGKVNQLPFPLLFDAYGETILFEGWSFKQHASWRNSTIGNPPIDIEMKFIEKQVEWDTGTKGWNDVWDPKSGWKRLLIHENTPAFATTDLENLFKQ